MTLFDRQELLQQIRQCTARNTAITVAIDGPCASGKTTLSAFLSRELDANLFHMDDFFLRPHQRTPERYREAGGNVDRERFLEEILEPLRRGVPFSYRPYDCQMQSLGDEIEVTPKQINIVEGSYALHPSLVPYYDLRILLDISPKTQKERLQKRDPAALSMFLERWIPLENAYFKTLSPGMIDLRVSGEGE